MKIKDIKAGTDYRYDTGGRYVVGKRIRVLDTDCEIAGRRAWDDPTPAFRVQEVDKQTGEPYKGGAGIPHLESKRTCARFFVSTWEEHERQLAEKSKHNARATAWQDENQDRQAQRNARAFAALRAKAPLAGSETNRAERDPAELTETTKLFLKGEGIRATSIPASRLLIDVADLEALLGLDPLPEHVEITWAEFCEQQGWIGEGN